MIMIVRELIRELQRWPQDMEAVVGMPLNDYLGRTAASTPVVKEAWKKQSFSDTPWMISDEEPDAEYWDNYNRVVVIG